MNPLEKVIADINKEAKQEIITLGPKYVYHERIPFTSPRMNYMTYGGIPVGKATELFGPENGGKTTTALDLVKNAQERARGIWDVSVQEVRAERIEQEQDREGNNKTKAKAAEKRIEEIDKELEKLDTDGPRRVYYCDAENTLDMDWADLNGVDISHMYLDRPQEETAETVLNRLMKVIGSGHCEMIVLDSLPMLVPQALYKKSFEDRAYGGISGVLTEFSRQVAGKLSKTKTTLIGINQSREDLESKFNIYKTSGGRAWKHLCSVRLYVRKGHYINEANEELTNKESLTPAGNLVDISLVKTKAFKPDRRAAQYTLNYKDGIDVLADTMFTALKFDMIVQSGSWFNLMGAGGEILQKIQGEASVIAYLRDNPEVFEELYEAVYERLKG